MNKPSICLNMIVKNEEHIIIETLNNLCSYITFDYWVISDTGSTDITKSLITTFFAEKQIPGELVDHEWKDFGYNRSKALESAYNKTDYLLIFDADDKIIGDFKLPGVFANATSGTPIVDSYQLKFELYFTYTRPLLINNRKKWCFKGVLHETLSALETMGGEEILEGDYYLESGKSGNRSKNPNKYLDDAIVLKNAFEKELTTDYGMACRYAFYCAQSYKDYGHSHRNESIKWYKKVLDLHNWSQEKYYACCMIGDMYKEMDDNENAVKYWVKSAEYDNERIEGIVDAMEYYRNTGQNILANALYHKFKNYSKIVGDKLFVTQSKYNDELEYNNSISAYYVNDHRSGYDCCKKILINQLLSTSLLQMTLSNILFYKDILESELAEDCIDLFYAVDNLICDMYNINESCSASEFELWELLFAKTRTILTKSSSLVLKNKPSPKVFISFTTCKRLDLFRETVNSILNHWTDVDKIDYWFCVDDNSSEYDREQMKRKYNWFDYYLKTPEEKGHRQSMNIIWNKLAELKPTYWIHMEDDFLFHNKMDYVSEAMNVLTNGEPENVKQILFNRNYGETIEDYNIKGHVVTENVDTVIHHHKIGDFPYTNCHYWPHYSFRPSMIVVDTILTLGNFESSNQFFEMDYANKWSNSGYKSGFFNRITNRHIGRLTSERNSGVVKNAYELNSEEQFQNPSIEVANTIARVKSSIQIVNLERRLDRKNATIQKLCDSGVNVDAYDFINAVDGKQLQPTAELSYIFKGNDFGSRKGVIGCAMSHYNLWKQLLNDNNNEYYLIMEDDFTLCNDFNDKIAILKNDFIEKDVIFLGYHMFSYNREHVANIYNTESINTEIDILNNDLYIGGTHCYSINKQGAQIMVNYIRKNGIKHGIDYVMKINTLLNKFETKPHLVFADWNEEGKLIDTDIQNDQDSLELLINTDDYMTELHTQNPIHKRNRANIEGNMLLRLKNEFVFVPNVDQIKYDMYYHQNTLKEYLKIANQDVNCVAVNSLGYFKNRIEQLVPSPYFGENDGIYIKKDYYNKMDKDKMKLSNYTFTNTWFSYSNIKSIIKIIDNNCFFINENNEIIHQLNNTNVINMLEIGCHEGAFSTYMADNFLMNDDSILHCVDPYDINDSTTPVNNKTKDIFLNNIKLSKNYKKIKLFENYSNDFFELPTSNILCGTGFLQKLKYDLIYIDGLHTQEQVINDIKNSCVHLSNNGIIWIDDYDSNLKQCIDNWLDLHKDIYKIVFKKYQLAFVHRLPNRDLEVFGYDSVKKPSKLPIRVEHGRMSCIEGGVDEAPRTRIKMLCNWCSSEQLCKDWSNMCEDEFKWKRFELVWTDNIADIGANRSVSGGTRPTSGTSAEEVDYYVIINYPPPGAYYEPSKTIIFQMEPWVYDLNKNWGVKTWGEWSVPECDIFLHIHSHKQNLNCVQWQIEYPIAKLQNDIVINKLNMVASICSDKYHDDGHILRVDFIKYIDSMNLEANIIDVFGRDNYHNFKSYIGPLLDDNKINGLIPYKYYFMPENNAERNYATEKIWEPILCECLCFYWGCPNLEDYIDSRAFVRLPLDNFEESLAIVKKAIEEDWWSHRIEFIREAKRKILNELAFFPTLEKIIESGEEIRR